MGIYPLLDREKVLFHPYLPYKLSKEVEIPCIHLVWVLDVLFEGLNFLASFYSLTAPKKWFFGGFFSIFSVFEFVPHITPLQIELRT